MRLSRWDSKLSSEQTNAFCKEISVILLSRIRDEEARRELRDYLDRDDFLALSDVCINYHAASVADAISIRQLQALFQKRRDLGDDVAREINALRTFREAERLCSESNTLFRKWSRGGIQFPPRVEAAFHAAQRKIAIVLGDVPCLSDLHIRFGPGSTTNVQKRNASSRNKLGAPLACSGELSGHLQTCLEEMPGWFPSTSQGWRVPQSLEVPPATSIVTVEIHSGRLVFVPKDRKTFRAIGPEPVINGMFQLGIGTYIAKRLHRHGVDISDQTANQCAARSGSIDGGLATLDLSSASDTVSIGLVEHLLPHDWVTFLSRFRTGTLEYGDSIMRLEKFSTMGNGFTFPLETLIFWALAQAVCVNKAECDAIRVFGDDIIIPTHRYASLVEVLTAAGFVINSKKSFAEGPFRESCGTDYLSGIDIRPYYLRDRLSGESAFSFYNFCAREFDREMCDTILTYLSPEVILWGPDGYGDGHLISDDRDHFTRSPKCATMGYSGWTFETYTWKKRESFQVTSGDRVLPSYSVYELGEPPPFVWKDLPYKLTHPWVNEVASLLESSATTYYKRGKLCTTVPGKRGYKRIKIYVFA